VALYEAVLSLMESMLPEHGVAGIVRERTGASLVGITPSNSYCTGNSPYAAIGANSDAIRARDDFFRDLKKASRRVSGKSSPRNSKKR
jgi:crotonobetainyl-CoA:carnitine CoA-transferase CaiB-like acyl-CoA transferase